MEESETALEEAIRLAGGMASLRSRLNERGHNITTHATIYQWKKTGRVPSDYCPDIEAISGVKCERLRPDVAWGVLRAANDPTLRPQIVTPTYVGPDRRKARP